MIYTGENRNTHTDLIGNPEEKRSLGRNRRRWEDNICICPQQDGIGMGTFPGSFKSGNKPLVSIKRENWLTSLASQNELTYSNVNKS